MASAEGSWRGMVRFPRNGSWRSFSSVLLTLALAALVEKLEAERHFLQKPFTPLSLARKVRDVLDGVSS